MTKELLLIDGNSLAFRAFYAMINQLERFVTKDKLHTNALVAFNNFFDQLMEKHNPEYALVAWDAGSGSTTFRAEQFENYKGDRQHAPEELVEQFPYFRKLVELHGVVSYEHAGIEADDIIGTLSKKGEEAGYKVNIYTGDRDLTQLVTNNVTVNVTKKGVSELDIYTPKFIAEKFDGLTPKQIIELKGLTGDTSDNYPGVTKVGEKTALKLLTEFQTIDGIYQNIDQMKESKLKENLIHDKEVAYQAKFLATIKTDAELDVSIDRLKNKPIDYEKLVPFYQELEFRQQLAKINALQNIDSNKINGEDSKSFEELTNKNLNKLTEIDKNEPLAFFIEIEGQDYHVDEPIGFAIGNETVGFFATADLSLLKSDTVKKTLLDAKKIATFDAKKLIVLAKRLNLQLAKIDFDFLLVSYLLDTVNNSNNLAQLAEKFDVFLANDEDVFGKGAKYAIPNKEKLLSFLADKAKAIIATQKPTIELLMQREELHLYTDIELPLTYVLANMEIDGMFLDQSAMIEFGKDLQQRIEELKANIFKEAGEEINLNSPKQLGELLFEKMGIPPVKKTKTGYSTSVEVLEQIATHVPFVSEILNYRQLTKLNSTYVEGLLNVVNQNDSKVHTHFIQTLTQTGRLSSNDPNMQNIPIRDEEGKKLRKAFVGSEKGWQIFSSDYSQIELRVLAHITGDKMLQQSFMNDEDIHSATARSIFGVEGEISYEMRRKAKAVNFGIVYGISDYGLATRLGIPRQEGKEIIERYYAEFPGVKKWLDEIVKSAHQKGYVETISHRRRYLPDIHSKNFNLRSFAERTAMNAPIQGSAADIIKIAMNKLSEELAQKKLSAKLLLQIHDELVLEAPEEEINILEELVPAVMDQAVELAIPLKVESHFGPSWYDAK